MPWVTRAGSRIDAGEHLGTGGEGRVSTWTKDRCVKILDPAPTAERLRKLEAMIALGPGPLRGSVAWPLDLVLDQAGGKAVGFVMQRMPGELLHQVFNAAERRIDHPELGYRFLVHVARNVAAALKDLHQHGVIIGDLNSSGILVDPATAQVGLIDIDSVQLLVGTERFTCDVGRGEYLPPELHGVRLRGLWRSAASDNFSLAVLIFQLLCMGRHPYIGQSLGQGDLPDPDQAIAATGYAYGIDRQRFGWDRVPGWPYPELIAPTLAPLFEAAFAPLKAKRERPTAAIWLRALDAYAASLVDCPANVLHAHLRGVPCPWCDFRNRGKSFFAQRLGQASGVERVLTREALQREIDAIRLPIAARLAILERHAAQRAQRPYLARAVSLLRLVMVLGLVVALPIGCGAVVAGHGSTALLGLAACGVSALAWGAIRIIRMIAVHVRDDRRQIVGYLGRALEPGPYVAAWNEAVGAIMVVPEERQRTLSTLRLRHHAEALERHLGTFLLRHAQVRDIGPARLATLAAHGITTAADIDEQRIRHIKGFGPVLVAGLNAWRDGCMASLQYRPDTATIEQEAAQAGARRVNEAFDRLMRLAADIGADEAGRFEHLLREGTGLWLWECTVAAIDRVKLP